MKDKKAGRIAEISLRDLVAKEPELKGPSKDGKGPKGNKSSAGTPDAPSKSKKDGNRRKRNKGRS